MLFTLLPEERILMDVVGLKADLARKADPAMKAWVRDHLGMNVDHFLGCRMPVIREASKALYRDGKERKLSMQQILTSCDVLLQDGTYELRLIAFQWVHLARKHLESGHDQTLESWLGMYVDDWSDCDELCTHALGCFLIHFPEHASRVEQWALSDNPWMRRGAGVALIPGIRKGHFLQECLSVCTELVEDTHPLVRKGWIWSLKEVGKTAPEEVTGFLEQHGSRLTAGEKKVALKFVEP